MKRAHVILVISLALLLLSLVFGKRVDGFQNPLPTGNVTITHFVIYSSLNTIIEKLPFVHSNFTKVSSYDTANLSLVNGKVVQTPTGNPALFKDMSNLVPGSGERKMWAFELKESIVGPLDQSSIDALEDASKQLFGSVGKIAFRNNLGRLYPSIVPDPADIGTGGTTGGTETGGTTGGTETGGTTGGTETGGTETGGTGTTST